ncbi:archaemetzincin [Chryseobacterium bernardetii]|jgi:archaemetzincin|uniref:Archaemetzincin n=2 Tax=Chryseobacterium TaxID=59732 RepID=A0A543E982_9FLAO|nr:MULTISPECIES: archaemetzincin [Chryseobacterium]MDR6371699.1 archaemetzincin [Chryseobacterium vietnamense]MDR6443187.1 archaemetzincin [Chryseobacterium bernardetii]MDR6488654.1 archaemetzincin [Chryseobacterium vietnamense]TQM18118.1 archaemetzincin [Chryseobacterium aquifrigidense]
MSRGKYNFTSVLFYVSLLILLFSCQKQKKTYYESIALNDIKLSSPKPGSWRSNHDEHFQTYEDFQKSKKIKPESGQNTIYLQPIGKFDELQKREIALTSEYLKIYFQLETKILPPLSNTIFPEKIKRISKEGQEQILASYVLDSILIKRKPKDAVVLMGITEKDLFPLPEWNYVFGLASYEEGVGVTSMYRFANGHLSDSNFNESFLRLIKISSHEIGHMFGISHCLNANCVMNGTNTLTETDYHLARACSLCQRKLNSSIHYDPEKRLLELKNFFEKQHLNTELSLSQQDLNLVQ